MNTQVAILAGGFATRLIPITLEVPKSLIQINGKPFIDWQLLLLSKSGVRRVLLLLGHKADQISDHIGDGSKFGIEVSYSFETTAMGTGGAIVNALPYLDEYFGLLYGDSYLPMDFNSVFATYRRIKSKALMVTFHNNNSYDESNAWLSNGKIVKYEKHSKDKRMTHVDAGYSVMSRKIFEDYPEPIPWDLSNLQSALAANLELDAHEMSNRFYEIGSLQGILDFQNFVDGEVS